MDYNFVSNIENCITLIQEYVPVGMVYYSHIPAAFLSVVVGLFVFMRGGKTLANSFLLAFCLTFSVWSLFDIILWTSADSRQYMFFWSTMGTLEYLLFVFGFLFLFAFLRKKLPPFSVQLLFLFLLLPLVFTLPTTYHLTNFDSVECVPAESTFDQYYLLPANVLVFVSMFLCGVWFIYKSNKSDRRPFLFIFFGISLLLSFFIVADSFVNYLINNEITSPTVGYTYEFYWLFGMPIFLALLAYTIVKYHSFHIRLLGAQALVAGLVVLIGAQFTFIRNPTNMILNAIAFFLSIVFGVILVRSVKHEIEQHEQALELADNLNAVNIRLQELDKQKSEFLSIASHQLRTPLSIIKGYVSLMEDGAYGKINAKMAPILQNIDVSNERLVKLVDEFLDVSRLEQGRTQYSFGSANLSTMLDGVITELSTKADAKQIKLEVKKQGDIPPTLVADEERIRHGVFNYIDNAIKYSPEKSTIIITLAFQDGKVVYSVKDQGVGLDQFDIQNLFQKFYRSPKVIKDFQGTGLGLYVVKEFVEAHGGEVYVKSKGVNKGSEFGFWIPLQPQSDTYTQWVDEHKNDNT